MKAAIICNGFIGNYESCKEHLKKVDAVICADGGTRHAYKLGITPDIIIGDLDSSGSEYIEHFKSKAVPIIKYSSHKDKTDTHICLEYAMEKYDEIILLGASGSRLDHTLGNISILRLAADQGKTAWMMDENNALTIIKDRIRLEGSKGDILSLLPLSSRVEGITIKGVSYPLENAVMEIGNPYGVSNQFENEVVELSIQSGYLIVIKSKD